MKQEEISTSTHTVQLIDLAEFNPNHTDENGQKILKNSNPLHSVKIKLQVQIGQLEISLGELLNAKESQIFTLRNSINEPIDLILEGQIVARGQLVAVDGCFAIKVTEIPLKLTT